MTIRDEDSARRFAAVENYITILEEKDKVERARFVAMLRRESGDEAADAHLAKMRDLDLGIEGARNRWHSISSAQRRALREAATHGGRLDRIGKTYQLNAQGQTKQPVYVATVRNLCSRDLMAWDGGAFDPESAAIVTERGHFVLRHGPEG